MIYRCGLSTNKFLIILLSITCVQTKEILHSSVLQKSSHTNEHTSIKNHRFDEKLSSINDELTNNKNSNNDHTNFISGNNKKTNALSHNINNFKLNIHYSDNFIVSSSNLTSQTYVPTSKTPSPSSSRQRINAHNFTDSNKIQLEISANRNGKDSIIRAALRVAAQQGLEAMREFYDEQEPSLLKKGIYLPENHPGAKLSQFGLSTSDNLRNNTKAAYAAIVTAKKLKNSLKIDFSEKSRQTPPKISLRRTSLEAFCPPRDQLFCAPITQRYRTHDGTCNNPRKVRLGAAQMPFNRFQSPEYSDGIEEIRLSVSGAPLPSPRLISLLVHGSRESDSPVTLMLAQWGQFIDHDLTSTAQPKSINGSVPQCCGVSELHPSCAPIKVPTDDPWLAPLGIRCLEFLRSAPAQRRDCLLSWREQTNQVTSYLDASTIYSSNERNAERSRLFSNGLLIFGRGSSKDDVCLRGAFSNQCIRAGDVRSGEQPGLLAMHHTWVLEHNRIATELADMNLHWSDEKIYQETRRIIGAMIQHITYREFLPLVLGREVCNLFDLELQSSGYFTKYDPRTNPTIANAFSAAAFRFGHSLIQNTYMRSTKNHQFLDNNVTLHEENSIGDIGGVGSLHRLLRGLSIQRAQKRDEFITAELTNHLFQSGSFPFGLDLAAINIQRGRDHGLPAYVQWREPCGLSPILNWDDLERVIGPKSTLRIQNAYRHVGDVDLFVGGLAERPVVGGLVGPVFACIIAQQFSNIRKGDRFWYENGDFESSFTPAQLQSIRHVNLAQVICGSLGGGTLQPHIFLPHTITTNERIECGTGTLAPIDLKPWLERDPFFKNNHKLNDTTTADSQRLTAHENFSINPNEKIVIKLDFPPTSNSIDIRKHNDAFNVTATVINNKLDLDLNQKRLNTMTQANSNKKENTRQKTSNQTSLNKKQRTTTMTPTKRPRPSTTKHTKKRNRTKQKRDVNIAPDDKARSTIHIKLDKQTDDGQKSPFSGLGGKKRIDKEIINKMSDKEFVIVTPDQNSYDIEIKIKPKQPSSTNEKIIVDSNENSQYNYQNYQNDVQVHVTTKRPDQFYNNAHQPILLDIQYGQQSDESTITEITNRPYKRPMTTTRRYPYNVEEDEITTRKPYFTTNKPLYDTNDFQQDDDKPFYAYPSVQNTDNSYYTAANDGTDLQNVHPSYPNHNSNNYRPYHMAKPFYTNYLNRPSIVRPPLNIQNENRPSNTYNNLNLNQNFNQRPHQSDLPNPNYGSIYLDDIPTTTRLPEKLTTTFNVHSDDEELLDSHPNGYGYGYGSMNTNRPQDFVTFYTVMTTTKKRRRTKPTRPMTNYQNDDDDEHECDDENATTSYFSPTAVFSNIVNTFTDYFNGPTTTRKPYIQHDDFYTYPSLPHDDPYSRQIPKRTLNRVQRHSNFDMDYDQSTFPAALNSHKDFDDVNKTNAFDHDGYLRPEHFNLNQKLDFSIKAQMDITIKRTNTTQNKQKFSNKQNARHDKQITTLTNDQRHPIRVAVPSVNRPIGFVPINVLTKPERLDNWVMYDELQKVPLPRLPPLRSDQQENSQEMPRPIAPMQNLRAT